MIFPNYNRTCRKNLFYLFIRNGLLLAFLILVFLVFCKFIPNVLKRSQQDVTERNFIVQNPIVFSMMPQVYHKYLVNRNKSFASSASTMNVSSSKMLFQPLKIDEIRRKISVYNQLQTVLNKDAFGPLQNDSTVIIIQVHRRLMYLKHTINSLAQMIGIENTLLVFSHDFYDEEINHTVQAIKFCKVIQIFFPYSIQIHLNEFPGESKNDCPRNINIKEAIKRKCNNALYPDQYGHYREAKFTQPKHHWWWKINRVFNGLSITKNYTGLVVFLEDDHYVASDFLYMLDLMKYAQPSVCPDCKILTSGPYTKISDFAANSKKAEIMQWSSVRNNLAIAFNRSVWEELEICAKIFCTYDDYNWDWSLLAVSNICFYKELTAITLKAPRIFHIGECGLHFTKDCDNTDVLRSVQELLADSSANLFPKDLYFTYVDSEFSKNIQNNGGWGDIRDHNLCFKIVEELL